MSSKQRKVLRKGLDMPQTTEAENTQAGNLVHRDPGARRYPVALPPRTRTILERGVANRATLQALLQKEEQSINDLVAVTREMLQVPPDWRLDDTAVGFVPPAETAPPVE
jgi:hypothetical protein